VQTNSFVEQYFQNSAGSTLRQRIDEQNGKPVSAILLDFEQSRKSYHLIYDKKHAYELACLTKLFEPHPNVDREAAAGGQDQIQGLRVVGITTTAKIFGKNQVTGKAWAAPELAMLVLREDSTLRFPDGTKEHIVVEPLEVKIGEDSQSRCSVLTAPF
jgi:hypothetical protein